MSQINKKEEAIIYARVSSTKQLREGHGNDAQVHNGRNLAATNQWRLLETFSEPGISGALTKRPEMERMLNFLKQRHEQGKRTIVIIDDLKRFSRDMGGYLELKEIVVGCGARLASPNFRFEDTPEGEFFELLTVLTGQLERKQNTRQVIQKMKARIECGYWPFPATPPGLKLVREKEHGKIMRRDEPAATIVAEALAGFAEGRLRTQSDVQDFIVGQGLYSASPMKPTQARRLLDRSLIYAGYLEYKPWRVTRVKGHHDALISFEMHLRVQERLFNETSAIIRKDMREEFPLRGWVVCNSCHVKLTAQWCKGNGGRYPKYWCRNRDCALYGKTIKREQLENDFEDLLNKIKPLKSMRDLSKENLVRKWQKKMQTVEGRYKDMQRELADIDAQVTSFAKRAALARSETLAAAYERQIEDLENRRLVLEERLPRLAPDTFEFRTALERVDNFLKNPLKEWRKPDLKNKHRVLQMCFSGQLEYERNQGFKTTNYSLTYAFLSGSIHPQLTGCGHGGS